jgi:hypothetical protein
LRLEVKYDISKVDENNKSNKVNGDLVTIIFLMTVLLLVSVVSPILLMHSTSWQGLNADYTIFQLVLQVANGQGIASHLPIALQSSSQASPLLLSSPTSNNSNYIKLDITSSRLIHGVAGQFIRIKGSITNLNPRDAQLGGIAYISLVDNKLKVPVDLEDWSAEKGLYIPSLGINQSLPLEWNVRLVKAGTYTVDILFNKDGDYSMPPVSSSKILMEVAPKLNLNPGNVLPVAFGVPASLMALLGALHYIRGRKTGIYG